MAKKKNKMEGFSSFLNNSVDFTLLITVLLLLALGLIMVLSASAPTAAAKNNNNSYYYFIRQLIFAVIGLFLMYFISRIDYRLYQRFYKHAWWISILLLIAVFAFGSDSHGAKRWIDLGIITFQPSEIVKILMIIFYAGILVKDREELGSFWKGIVKHLLYLVPIAVLLVIEPHVSTTMVISIVV